MPNRSEGVLSRLAFPAVVPDDFEALVALRIAAMRESLERVGRFDPGRARERLRTTFAPSHTFHVILDGEKVGFYALTPSLEGVSLDHLYIHPRAQNLGIGTLVVRRCIARADEMGLALFVSALRDSVSNRFYLRHGFVQRAEETWDIHYVRPVADGAERRLK